MRKDFVPKKDIDLVVDGLNKYFMHMTQMEEFSPLEMKESMEPIFTAAGYRHKVKLQNVAGVKYTTNILLIHDSGLGDFIALSATIRETRRLYPKAHISLIVTSNAEVLAEHCPYVNEIIVNEAKFNPTNIVEMYGWNAQFAKKLLVHRFDVCYAFNNNASSVLLGYMSGAKELVALKFGADTNYIFAVPNGIHCYHLALLITIEVPHKLHGYHMTDLLLGYLDYTMHAPIDNRELEVWYTPIDLNFVKNLINFNGAQKIYALAMGGSVPIKRWQPYNYAHLVMEIAGRESQISFVIIGGGQLDAQYSEAFRKTVGENFWNEYILDLTNKINYRQNVALLSLCDMYIGNDTGAMNAAAAVKVPCLVTCCFPADIIMDDNVSIPKSWYPYHVPSVIVQPEHALSECKQSPSAYGCRIYNMPHCITQITVEKMLEGYETLKQRIADNNIEPLFIS